MMIRNISNGAIQYVELIRILSSGGLSKAIKGLTLKDTKKCSISRAHYSADILAMTVPLTLKTMDSKLKLSCVCYAFPYERITPYFYFDMFLRRYS